MLKKIAPEETASFPIPLQPKNTEDALILLSVPIKLNRCWYGFLDSSTLVLRGSASSLKTQWPKELGNGDNGEETKNWANLWETTSSPKQQSRLTLIAFF